jgi:hypothetical protein
MQYGQAFLPDVVTAGTRQCVCVCMCVCARSADLEKFMSMLDFSSSWLKLEQDTRWFLKSEATQDLLFMVSKLDTFFPKICISSKMIKDWHTNPAACSDVYWS